jgi:hypothetical protein
MADKKVPQEPCILCHKNPCDCGTPVSRKRAMAAREKKREEKDNGSGEAQAHTEHQPQ